MDEPLSFGQWLRRRRRELDLTQEELGRRVGCARITIRKIEADQMRPSRQLAELLMESIGVPAEERENFIRFARGRWPAEPVATTTPKHNLPPSLTSFIGRAREIAEVDKLLEIHRLVTLTGSGGIGKTRLALQVATDALDQFRDGVWLVELAPLRDGKLIPQTVLHVLRLSAESRRQPLEILIDYLSGRSLLIILDNCEHLLEDCCSITDAILQAAPAVKVLATSREALNLAGEQAYRVPSLAAPHANDLPSVEQLVDFEAVHLFIERAALVSPGFHVAKGNALALAQICERLDGIPLAIELAAARVKAMPLEAIVSYLDDRFQLLTGGSRNILPRQQTLRATIDWSYALLSEREKSLLQRLCVFRGGWTLQAAELVCSGGGIEQADVLDLLSKLVDKSLLWLEESGRYQMLETVRQYADEKLVDAGEADWARDRHLQFMLDLAERAEPEMRGQNQLVWLDRLEAELDNWRAALAWASHRNPELYLCLASALWRFWSVRVVHDEGIEQLKQALSRTENSRNVTRARALARLAFLYTAGGLHHKLAEPFAHEAYGLSAQLQDKPSMGMALVTLSFSKVLAKPDEAVSLAQQALEISREIGDHWLATDVFRCLGMAARTRNDLTAAASFHEQELAEARLSGDNRVVAHTLVQLAQVNLALGNAAEAGILLHEALPLAGAIRDRANVAVCHANLALLAMFLQDYARAEQLMEETLYLGQAMNSMLFFADVHKYWGMLEWARGNGSAVCQREETSIKLARQVNEPIVAAEALSLLAEGHRLNGEIDLARHRCAEALVGFRAVAFRQGYCHCLQGFGALALVSGQAERAVRLFAGRAKLRETAFTEDFYPFMVRERENQIAEARAQLGEEAFNTAWAEGQGMSEEEMLAYALEDRTDD